MRSVVFAIPVLDSGGPDKVMYQVACGLELRGWRVRFAVTSTEGEYAAKLPDTIPLEVVTRSRIRIVRRYPVYGLFREMRRSKPDVVLTTLRMNMTAGLGRWAWPRRVQLVARVANHVSANAAELSTGGVKYRMAAGLERRALNAADHIVAQSASMAGDLAALGVTPLVTTIGNPAGSVLRTESFSLAGAPAVVAVGRLVPQKGFDVLIAAMPAIRQRHPAAHLTIFGEGPSRPQLEETIDRLGLIEAVSLPGSSSSAVAAMASAALVVSPSRYEGFSNVILEALVAGTPVVATTCPGAAEEVVRPGTDGFLVPPERPDELAAAVVLALDEPSRWNRTEIAQRASAEWSTDSIVDKYESLLIATIEGAR